MKRQAGREATSPSRAAAKRMRERDRERDRDRERERERDRDREGVRREELAPPPPPPPLALLLAESRGYHRRSRSREREKLHHHHRHELSLLGRAPAGPPPGGAGTALSTARPGTLEYKTLLISNLGSQVSDEDVEDALFHEFKKFGDVSVKLSHTPELGRIAYVNFRHPEDAREARHAKASRLALGERPLKMEPMYVRRRSVTPPDAGGFLPLHAPYPYRQRSLSPPGAGGVSVAGGLRELRELRARHYALETLGLGRERERLLDYYGMLDERGRPYGFPPAPPSLAPPPPAALVMAAAAAAAAADDLKPEDDQRATSNLFIGNLDGNVTEAELRRGFDKYGAIEDVVIKRPARGQGGAYAFVKFQNLDMAHRAKVAMQGRLVGGNPVKIGYGKANPTTRLWVGGLGAGNSLAALAREFDRFGSIRCIDYAKGDSHAYVQYESLDAAQAACTQMRGFPLGGADRRLRVDFARVEESAAGRPFPAAGYPPPLPAPPVGYELLGEAFGRRRSLERELRGGGARERSPPPAHSLLALRERALLDRDFPGGRAAPVEAFGRSGGVGRTARSRSRSRERWIKEREERRGGGRRRSRSASADKPAPTEEKEKERGRARRAGTGAITNAVNANAGSPEASPDRARVRAPDSTTEPRDHSPDTPAEEEAPPGRHHGKQAGGEGGGVGGVSPVTAAAGGSLWEFAQAALTRLWRGFFALKNSSFPTDLFLLEGGASFFGAVMREAASGGGGQLKIAQRLRMDQTRLDEVGRRIALGRPHNGFAVLLALQGPLERRAPAPEAGLQVRLLRHLVTYLRNKEAAGVVSLPAAKEGGPGAMLYAFPPGPFSQQFLQKSARRTAGGTEEEHMVVVIVNDTN